MTDDAIGPIYSGYVPFHPWKSGCATAFSYVEVARLEEPIQVVGIIVRSVNANLFYRAWKEASFGGDRTAVPSDNENLRSERSTTELAGPGICPSYDNTFFFPIPDATCPRSNTEVDRDVLSPFGLKIVSSLKLKIVALNFLQ